MHSAEWLSQRLKNTTSSIKCHEKYRLSWQQSSDGLVGNVITKTASDALRTRITDSSSSPISTFAMVIIHYVTRWSNSIWSSYNCLCRMLLSHIVISSLEPASPAIMLACCFALVTSASRASTHFDLTLQRRVRRCVKNESIIAKETRYVPRYVFWWYCM